MSCTLCPLHEDALSICIDGRGPNTAKILIVGQNPGSEEDFAGEAFIGKTGTLLDEMLRDAGIDPSEVRATNAVRCATPKGRAPLPAEITACSQHLKAEIEAIKPEVIIAMGDAAIKSLVGNKAISSVRGQAQPMHKRWDYKCDVFPTYHPNFVLRSPMARNTVVSDMRRVRDRLLPEIAVPWQWWDGEELPPGLLSYDIESIDENGNIVDYPTQISVTDGQTTYVSHEVFALAQMLVGREVVGHNTWGFDGPMLRQYSQTTIPYGYDTMVLAWLDDENQPLGLEALCVKYLGIKGWKNGKEAKFGSDEFAHYNARDAVYTLRLYWALRERLGDRLNKIADIVMAPARETLDGATARGVYIDQAAVQRVKTKKEAEAAAALAAVLSYTHEDFNPNSNNEVAQVLLDLGFSLPRTETGKPGVGKSVLHNIDHPFAKAVLQYREPTKTISTYIRPYSNTPDGRAHSTYKLTSTSVGRTAASNPNIQNLDRDLKDFLTAPPGYAFVTADYSALHFRLAAWCAGEQTILSRYAENPLWDPHRYFASPFYSKPEAEITKAERQIAKSANFSQLYLGAGETLQQYAAGMGISLELPFCNQLHRAWHKTFPGFVPWYAKTRDTLRSQGYVESVTGRRRRYGNISLLTRDQFMDALRECVPFQVLSLEADLSLLALGFAREAGLAVNYFCHDSIGAEVPADSDPQQLERLFRQCMIEQPLTVLREQFGVDLTVPLEIEITIQTNPSTQQLPGSQQIYYAASA